MDIYLFGLLSGVAAVTLEWRYAISPTFWTWRVIGWVLVCQPIIAYSIYRLVKASPNLIVAIVVFSFSTLCLRTILTLTIQRQNISTGTWVALGLLVLSQLARRF